MYYRLATLLFFVLIAGCAVIEADHFSETSQACLKNNVRFVDAWGCVQTRVALGKIDDSDKRLPALLAEGDRLAGQVTAHKMSDSAARKQLTATLIEAGK